MRYLVVVSVAGAVLVVALSVIAILGPDDEHSLVSGGSLSGPQQARSAPQQLEGSIDARQQTTGRPAPDLEPEPSLEANRSVYEMSEFEFLENLRSFRKSRGYFDDSDELPYKGYTDQALENLAAAGDLLALHMLAGRAMRAADAPTAVALMRDAAARGSTRALESLGSMFFGSYTEETPVPAGQLPESAAIGLAMYEVGAMRGDISLLFRGISKAEYYNVSMDRHAEQVRAMAEEIYADLESRRAELGLGAFDNSVPVEVEFSNQNLQHFTRNPTGWGIDYYH